MRVTSLPAFLCALVVADGAAGLQPLPRQICQTDERVEGVLVVGRTVFLAGRFTKVRPPGAGPGDPSEVDRTWFAACDLFSGEVLAWDPAVECDPLVSNCTNARGQTLALAPGGMSLFLGGKFNQVDGVERRHLARVGLLDASVEPWDPRPNDRVQRIVVAPDGERVYVGGNFSAVTCIPGGGSCGRARLAAWDTTTGDLVSAFTPAVAAGGFSTVRSLAFSEDATTLFIGGQFDTLNRLPRSGFGAVDAATGLTTTGFAPNLEDPNPEDPFVQVHEIVVRGDEVYGCGDWWVTEGQGSQVDQRNINRFDASTGLADPTFWLGTDGGVQSCTLVEDLDILVVGGHFDCVIPHVAGVPEPNQPPCGGDPGFHGQVQRDIVALRLTDGSRFPWNPDTGGIPGTWALAAVPGTLVVGGGLTWPRTGATTHENLLAFELPLFADGFETGSAARWSATVGR